MSNDKTPKIYYYTFLDSCINDYIEVNSNFVELTKNENYFILISGTINEKPYAEYLKNKLGENTVFIESEVNSFPIKFNLFKKYLTEHKEKYENSIFCKIDSDLIHYDVEQFHDFLRKKFSESKKYFIGSKRSSWIRGGLNAIHVDSIIKCPDLDTSRAGDFDIVFTNTLNSNNLVNLLVCDLFIEARDVKKPFYATHIVKVGSKKEKTEELKQLVSKLEKYSIKDKN